MLSALALVVTLPSPALAGASGDRPRLEPQSDARSPDDLATLDARGAAESIGVVLADIQALSPKDRAAAGASLAILSVECPYTRASRQIPFALLETVSSIDPSQVDPLVDTDLATLQRGLKTHIAVSDALDRELAMPAPGDALFGAPGLLDRAAMERSPDLLGETTLFVDHVPERVAALGPETIEVITQHTHRVDRTTGHIWTLTPQIRGWHAALQRLLPFVTDPDARMRVQRAVEMLDRYRGMGC
ncbi:MAG: hypothetical protein R3F61_35860 [Myxococcota bacterium]